MKHLMLNNTQIKTIAKGLFCLDDIFQASGAKNTNRPVMFIESEMARNLKVDVLDYEYVNLEVAGGYAKWVSTKFYMDFTTAYHEWFMSERKDNKAFFDAVAKESKHSRVAESIDDTSEFPLLKMLMEICKK